MVYLFAHVKLKSGSVGQFTELLQGVTPVLGRLGGWKLLGSYFNSIGRLNSVVDVWELPDANAVQSTLDKAAHDPEWQKWVPVIEEIVEDETLQILTKLPV
jgi:hypothetical protein